MEILFEDNHLLVTVKPQGIPVQEDSSKDEDFLSMLKNMIKARDNKPGNVYLALVHRLDRPTGGVMVFAKSSKAASRLAEQFREREAGKHYLAIVHGVLKESKRLENWILKDNATNISKIVSEKTKGAKQAVLNLKTKQYTDKMTLLEIELETGRSHQIRAQLANIKYPIYGDHKYGTSKGKAELALWAYKLTLIHPVSKAKYTFEAEPPKEYPWDKFNI